MLSALPVKRIRNSNWNSVEKKTSFPWKQERGGMAEEGKKIRKKNAGAREACFNYLNEAVGGPSRGGNTFRQDRNANAGRRVRSSGNGQLAPFSPGYRVFGVGVHLPRQPGNLSIRSPRSWRFTRTNLVGITTTLKVSKENGGGGEEEGKPSWT